jgi:acyl phosphate:glycerol-3-phosphate acyltransferase
MKHALLLAAAYLLGSIPFSYFLVRWLRGLDVRTLGSGNPGAANVLRVAGKGAGTTAFVFDAAKGAAAVVLARSWDAEPRWVAASAVAVVLGHLFPLLLGFRGGKGVATGAGALAVLSPLAVALSALLFVALVLTTRFVAIGSVVAAIATPLSMQFVLPLWNVVSQPPSLIAAWVIGVLVVVRHWGNLVRLFERREARVFDPAEQRGPTQGKATESSR